MSQKFLPKGTRPGPDSDRHRQGLPWAQRAVQMFQCCGSDRLFSTQKAIKTHISNLTKIDEGVLLLRLFTSRSATERPGARPGRDSESALAASTAARRFCSG